MLFKVRIPDELWEQFLQKTSEPSSTVRTLVHLYVNGSLDEYFKSNKGEEQHEKE